MPYADHRAQQRGLFEMQEIQKTLPQFLGPWVPKNALVNGVPTLALVDIQNIMCEFSKYQAIRLGLRRRAKVGYVPGRGW